MPQDFIGWFHTLAAIVSLIAGSFILLNTKGTRVHKRVGRIYGISMLTVCATSFMIYRIHGSFGILHVLACISTATLLAGMLPLYLKRTSNYMTHHLSWMYWSVIGLYCAFAAEVFTRLPYILNIKNSYGIFYALVGISAGIVGGLGAKYFRKKKDLWIDQFGMSNSHPIK